MRKLQVLFMVLANAATSHLNHSEKIVNFRVIKSDDQQPNIITNTICLGSRTEVLLNNL